VEIEEKIFPFFVLLCEREVEENEEGQWNKKGILYLSPDASVMEETVQCLPHQHLDANPRAPGHRSPGPWSQGIFLFLFFLAGVHFFQGLDEVDFFDESLSSLSRLG